MANIQRYFGDSRDALYPAWYLTLHDQPSIIQLEQFATIKRLMNLQSLNFLHQVHGTQGAVITDTLPHPSFAQDGDFLLTNIPGVGIGVMTADCLPIIAYDHVHQAVAVIHAGWRGALAGVVLVALERMHTQYGTQLTDIELFFGPSAGVCCYTVGPDFAQHLAACEYRDQVLVGRSGQLFFDLPLFCRLQLELAGVSPNSIMRDNNLCTLCNECYFSHRRQKELAGRQMSVVSLPT